MRRSTLTLSSSLVAIGLSASIALAQQSSRAPATSVAPAPAPDDSIDPSMAARPTRYLLRNGLDYLAYREYTRALSFFRIVESRQAELNELELKQLKNGIARAQQGLRDAVNSTKTVAQTKGRSIVQPGAFALAKPPTAPTDPIQLVSAEMPAPPSISPAGLPVLPPITPAPDALVDPTPAQAPSTSTRPVFGVGATRRAPEFTPEPEPVAPALAPTADPLALPAQASSSSPGDLPPTLPAPTSRVATELPPPLVLEPSSPMPAIAPSPVELPPTIPSGSDLPTISPPPPMAVEAAPTPVESAPSPVPAEPVQPRAAVAQRAGDPVDSSSRSEPLPAAEAPPAADAVPMPSPPLANPAGNPSMRSEGILTPRLLREVEMVAQRPMPDQSKPGAAVDPFQAPPPSQGSTRLELPRAPSPTEARPLRQIHVPEEYVNLGKREWEPNRKYWAAAGTCHMILYFQDPVLERYGQSAEQALGPIGRYFSYPLDDPKQSNQRNQIIQPFYSMGKLAFQVGTLPYKLVVDPPWEAEYDLGYYRPGDRIPPDTIMITPYGVGPPLKGRQY